MKTIITLIASMSFLLSIAQTTLIPDANFEQVLIDLGYDTGAPDGSVPTANIDTITKFTISSNNISDLTGIEAMIALEEFYCGRELITSIDMSSNIALKKLSCWVNSSLSSINVSNNPLLEELVCEINNLNSLDVSNNPLLEKLSCGNNPITSLDVSQNPNLVYLSCSTTMITSLDVSSNSMLNTLFCFGNPQLECLNIKNGNNFNFYYMTAYNTPNLYCIEVDDPTMATSYWSSYIDQSCSFSTNCNNPCNNIASGIDEKEAIKLNVYPNPMTSIATIEFPNYGGESYSLSVFDMVGNVVRMVDDITTDQYTFNKEDLTEGLYFLEISSNFETFKSKIIVK